MGTRIEPFRIAVDDDVLTDLRDRLVQTRLPNETASAGWSQGFPLAVARRVLDHWRDRFDWRRQERRLNRYPQYLSTVDTQPVHFFHVTSPAGSALPLLDLVREQARRAGTVRPPGAAADGGHRGCEGSGSPHPDSPVRMNSNVRCWLRSVSGGRRGRRAGAPRSAGARRGGGPRGRPRSAGLPQCARPGDPAGVGAAAGGGPADRPRYCGWHDTGRGRGRGGGVRRGPGCGPGVRPGGRGDRRQVFRGVHRCRLRRRSGPHLVLTAPRRHGADPADADARGAIEADEVLAMGLIDAVVPAGTALDVALADARRHAAGPPRALALLKQNFVDPPADLDSARNREIDMQAELSNTDDYAEGIAAFHAKRRPRFAGR